MSKEKRIEPREPVDLPVRINGGEGDRARNISVFGLYFETSNAQHVGDFINIELEVETPEGPRLLQAEGQIKRIEHHGERTGVGVRLISRRLRPIEY